MKKRNVLCMIGFIISLTLLTSACGKKANDTATVMNEDISYSMNSSAQTSNYKDAGEISADIAVPAAGDFSATADAGSASNGLNSTTPLASDIAAQPQDKIIRTFYMDVETQEFDSLITKVEAEIKSLGGYTESSKINGKPYYSNNDTRYGNIVARIPSDKVDEFVSTVDGNANVINKQESTENVSLEYIEAESRIETLKIEQDRLFAIMDKEVSLENIITLESRLSDIRYELQNYESQLRLYDNQVAYSTVTMSIQEVDKLTPVTEEKQTVGTRIKNGFSNTMYKLSEGFKNFFVWFVVNLPYLLIWAIIIFAIVFIIRRLMKKSKKKTTAQQPAYYGPQMNPLLNQMNQNQPYPNQQGQNQQPLNQTPAQNQPDQNQ